MDTHSSDNDDNDDYDEVWEQVSSPPSPTTNNKENINFTIQENINFTIQGKMPRRKGITKLDRQRQELIHKSHAVLLILNSVHLNRLCDEQHLQAMLISLLSPSLIDRVTGSVKLSSSSRDKGRSLFDAHIKELLASLHDSFQISPEGLVPPEYSLKHLLDAVHLKSIDPPSFALLFVSLCRGLGFGVRLLVSLTPAPLKPKLPPLKPVNSTSSSISTSTTTTPPPLKDSTTKEKTPRKRIKTFQQSIDVSRVGLWAEFFFPPDKSWTSVDVFERDIGTLSRLSLTCPYIVALDALNDRVKDVSTKYLSDNMSKIRPLRCDPWWTDTLQKHFFGQIVDGEAEAIENELLLEKSNFNAMPTSISQYLNHPKYVLERHLKKYEVLHPKVPEAIVGKIRNDDIYLREYVHALHTREKWLSLECRVLRRNEEPVKYVKSRVVPGRNNNKIQQLRDDSDDEEQEVSANGMVGLFGEWQTEPYVPEAIVNGIIPKNKYQNMELFKPSMLPPGAAHISEESILSLAEKGRMATQIRMPSLKKIARTLKIDFAEAVVGFDTKCGHSYPLLDGIVVAVENENLVRDAYLEQLTKDLNKALATRQRDVMKRWEKLVKRALNHLRLKEQFQQ